MFLCCGDALFDLFESGSSDKPGAVGLTGHVGGSPMNVAVGLARLGHQSRYFTKLSSDLFGQRMRGYLAVNRIDHTLCIDTGVNTTLAIVETGSDGSASYVFYTDNTADVSIEASELPEDLPDEIRVLHFGSYSTAVEPTAGSLAALARSEQSKRIISYDPNLRPTIEPDIDKWRETFSAYASTANLIKASDEDIATLLGKNREEQFVADCFNHGAELVFITRGPDGASGYRMDGSTVQCEGVNVKVEDTVGAGDTFQATVLHWLSVHGHLDGSDSLVGEVDIEACMKFAINAAAITCTRKGADLPFINELSGFV
ncbi:hypothetical protein AB833_12640 [Chromatiales bacterium (ex Bugula neritina AB1)]|nr:hypothetical protein AB833_12640 [Chromatiales bacterium (ex Bugula neritina AB1)]